MSESSRGRGKKVAAPRGRGRRSQAERDQISAAERERNKERDALYAKEQSAAKLAQDRADRDQKRREEAAARGRGRGRGGFMGESHVKHELGSGPLSAGSVISPNIGQGKAFPRPWMPSRRSGAGRATSSTVDSDATPMGASSSKGHGLDFNFEEGIKTEAEDGGYISSDLDEPEEGQRRPIEAISLLTDDEDEDNTGSSRPLGAPVRLTRVEHRDRAVQVTADIRDSNVVKTEDEDVVMTDSPDLSRFKSQPRRSSVEITGERPWRGVWQDPVAPVIKDDPSTEAPSARAQGKLRDDVQSSESRTRKSQQNAPKSPILYNVEERNEHAREVEDNQVMLGEFGNVDAHVDGLRTYLFQFPPVLPNLSVRTPVAIKDDPDASPNQSQALPADTGNKEAPVKIEDDDPLEKDKLPRDQTIRPSHLPKLASGSAGKLRVHKSGKVTMDWGGSSFVVQNGLSPQFLQNLVLVKIDEQSPTAAFPGAMQGTATAFGQPRGKLIVQPDYDVMLDGAAKGLKIV